MRWTAALLKDRRILVLPIAVAALVSIVIAAALSLRPDPLSATVVTLNGSTVVLAARPELSRALPPELVKRARELGVVEALCGDSSWVQVKLEDRLTREAGAVCRPLIRGRTEIPPVQWKVEFGPDGSNTIVYAEGAAALAPDAAVDLAEQLEEMLDAVQRGRQTEAELRAWRERAE